MKTIRKRLCCLSLTGSLLFALVAMGSATPESTSVVVTIPFAFLIGGRQLPAGEYVIDRLEGPDELLFRNKNEKYVEQVFLVPARRSVAASDPKLVFIVRNGRYFLVELWGANGRRILTSQYGVPSQKGDTRRELAVSNSGNAVW
jgi:hypothetical protein